MRADLQSAAIAAMRRSQVRKGEDGSVDISFYDWHYCGSFKLRQRYNVYTHSLPDALRCHSPINLFARVERFELPTPGFGDQCSAKLSYTRILLFE